MSFALDYYDKKALVVLVFALGHHICNPVLFRISLSIIISSKLSSAEKATRIWWNRKPGKNIGTTTISGIKAEILHGTYIRNLFLTYFSRCVRPCLPYPSLPQLQQKKKLLLNIPLKEFSFLEQSTCFDSITIFYLGNWSILKGKVR